MKVFLGGTCNGSDWRNLIIPMLSVEFFNPTVKTWPLEGMEEKIPQRELCDIYLCFIVPSMDDSLYPIAEVIDDSNKRPQKTVFVCIREDEGWKFTYSQWKSLSAVAQMVERNGGTVFDNLKDAALHINSMPTKNQPLK